MLHFTRAEKAFAGPFLLFAALLGGVGLVRSWCAGSEHLLLRAPEQWIYPLQALLCGALVWRFWPVYGMKLPRGWGFSLFIAVLVLAIWIAPQQWLGQPPRLEGFDPTLFGEGTPAYFLVLALRFLRLVIVVPLVEEIFWRGFLCRYLIDDDFTRPPFGAFSWQSFGIVSLAFAGAHWGPDFIPALITGALYNIVAYRTRSLSSCVVAHAVTNGLLGGYIMATRQWGFW